MEALAVFASLTIVLVGLDVLAVRFGVDSRDESADPRAQVRPTGIVV